MNVVWRAVQRLRGRQSQDPGRDRARLYAYLGPDLALTQLVDGHFIYVDPSDEQIAHHLIARGYWEDWIDKAIASLVRPGDRVVDVGANLGYYTLRIAGMIGPAGRLDAFEANPRLAEIVARSVGFNGYDDRVRLHKAAAGDRCGELSFSISRRQGGSGHIAEAAADEGSARQTITVPCVRLDDVIEGPIDLLRMDAEGSEPLVLEGARTLLSRSPEIRICMEWANEMMSSRRSVPDLIAWLRGQGFRFWLIATDGAFPELSDAELLALPLNDLLICRSFPTGLNEQVRRTSS
jgi:FkbM family methyltransferase